MSPNGELTTVRMINLLVVYCKKSANETCALLLAHRKPIVFTSF